jgi:hypothetical protein
MINESKGGERGGDGVLVVLLTDEKQPPGPGMTHMKATGKRVTMAGFVVFVRKSSSPFSFQA